MSGVNPVVRHMLLCDDIRPNPSNPNKMDVLGLVSTIHAVAESDYPLHVPMLCVYLEIAGGRGIGQARIDCRQADSGLVMFSSPTHKLNFPPDPRAVRGLAFRLVDCMFPQSGLYWVQFCYNQQILTEQPVVVR